MCQKAGLLVGYDLSAGRALVSRANCDSWECPECSRRMADNWIVRAQIGARQYLKAGCTLDFVTITSHEKLPTFAACERVWSQSWPVLYAAIKRRTPSFQFMIIPEKHKNGRMHVHALWTGAVTQRWLKDNGRKRGLGYKSEVDHITDVLAAISYVTKYIGKSLGDDVPKRFRRVRTSQKWPKIPAPNTSTSQIKWEYVGGNGALEMVYAECQAKGIDLIDIETGEKFDDIDLGTISVNDIYT